MRAVQVRSFGSYEDAEVAEIADPVAGAGQVLLEIHAAPLNFVDLLVIGGKYQFLPKLPFTPGKGPAGRVLAVGEGVTSLAVGDRVLAMAEYGGYAQKIAVDAGQCYRLPDTLSFADAGAASLVFDTSWFALRDRARLQPGDTVLVLGATGGVGLASVQLAKAMGARVLAGISSLAKKQIALDAGADGVVDLSSPDLRESLRAQVHEQTGGAGVDVILDMLGGDIFDAAIRALAWRGRLVVVGFAAGRIPTLKVNYLLLKNIEVSGLQVSDYRKRRPEQVAECYREVFGFFESGALKPLPYTTLPLDDFRRGLKMIEERKTTGRLVLLPHG